MILLSRSHSYIHFTIRFFLCITIIALGFLFAFIVICCVIYSSNLLFAKSFRVSFLSASTTLSIFITFLSYMTILSTHSTSCFAEFNCMTFLPTFITFHCLTFIGSVALLSTSEAGYFSSYFVNPIHQFNFHFFKSFG